MRRSRTTAMSALLAVTLVLACPLTAAGLSPESAKAGNKAGNKAVTLKASHTQRTGGQRTVLRGKVRTERGVKREVDLELKLLGEWEELTTLRTSRTGAFKVAFTAPNPASSTRFRFRAVVDRVRSTKVRKAWRGSARSPKVSVRFDNNPASPQPSYTLADPAACATGTPGVMAQTAACVAAVEVQLLERLWLDTRLIDTRDDSTDALMQFAVEYVSAGTGQYGLFELIFPYTSAQYLQAEVAEAVESDMLFLALTIIASGLESVLASLDPSAAKATAWKPAWNDHFILKDLSQVRIAGATATTPERTHRGGESDTLTVGGTYTYVEGRWYPADGPEADALLNQRG